MNDERITKEEYLHALEVIKRYTAQKKRGYTVDEYNEIVERIRLGLVIALTSLTDGAFWEMTMEQLASKVSREQLQAVPNIGKVSIEQFDRMMDWAGYKIEEGT